MSNFFFFSKINIISLTLSIQDTDVERCGLNREADGSYSLVVVVQVNTKLSSVPPYDDADL